MGANSSSEMQPTKDWPPVQSSKNLTRVMYATETRNNHHMDLKNELIIYKSLTSHKNNIAACGNVLSKAAFILVF